MLSHRHCGKIFPPHMTLLSDIRADCQTIASVCEQIIESHPTFSIKLEDIAFTDKYYRNLYIQSKREKTLMNIYDKIKLHLEHGPSEVYSPHVSLLYGNLDTKKQQQLSEKLSNSYSKFFHCQRLDLYNTAGKESEWHLIKSYYFI